MIHPGDRLENPVTGEVLVFHQTSEQTGGELVRVETIVQPDGCVAAAHVHPAQTERFEILDGTVGFRLGRKTLRAGPGDVAFVSSGTPHRFWNAGSGEARFVCEIRPALRFESLIETMFTLAAEGKTNEQGLPGPLQLAVIADAHFDTVRLPFPPAPVQRAALAVGAPLGRMLGYQATIPRRRPGRRSETARTYDRGRPHSRPARGPER
jgi:quercetin dioxygenase-like cupin family protein